MERCRRDVDGVFDVRHTPCVAEIDFELRCDATSRNISPIALLVNMILALTGIPFPIPTV